MRGRCDRWRADARSSPLRRRAPDVDAGRDARRTARRMARPPLAAHGLDGRVRPARRHHRAAPPHP
eukprot:2419503-Prymnesium_polylepis.1